MDSFESLIAMLLQRKGYWVRTSFKVELTKDEKKAIGRPSSPRWEIDLVAYKGDANELLAVECKSYLDSVGVRFSGFDEGQSDLPSRYKLFTDNTLREVVLRRLAMQLTETGSCAAEPSVRLALAAGKIATNSDREKLKNRIEERGWLLFDEDWIREALKAVASSAYENDVAAMVAKLLKR